MTGTELMNKSRIRERVFDTYNTTYTDEELVAYMNEAINIVWTGLGTLGYFEVIGDKIFTTATESLPSDFLRFTSSVPIIPKSDGTTDIYGSLPQVTRYIRKPQFIDGLSSNLPFKNDSINNVLGQIVVMLALNRNAYDVSFEQAAINELRKVIV